MRYHCYIGAYDSVYSTDIDAGSATEAASRAAAEQKIEGRWTVVPGERMYVDIVERTTYEATLVASD